MDSVPILEDLRVSAYLAFFIRVTQGLEEKVEKRTDCCPGQSEELADLKSDSVVCPSSYNSAPALWLRSQPARKTTPLVFLLEGT